MLPLNTRPLRILMTTDSVGGVWRYAMDACAELKRQGAEVALACIGPAPSPGQHQEAARAGLELVCLEAELDWMADDTEAIHATAKSIEQLVRDWRPSVLHLNAPAVAGFLEQELPCVVGAHSCLATWWAAVRQSRFPEDWNWYVRTIKAGFSAADTIVVPTRAFGTALCGAYGPLPQLRIVENATAPIDPDAKGNFALAVGRWWDDGKNARILDAAAARTNCPVYAAGPLIGPNGTAATFHSVGWAGDLRYDDMRGWLARAPIFVSPSLYEPFGLAVLEAATAGAALVLSDIPTFRELWDRAAVFVDPRNPDAIAKAIDFLANDADARERLAHAAQQTALRYTIPRQAAELMDAYTSAVSAHSRAA